MKNLIYKAIFITLLLGWGTTGVAHHSFSATFTDDAKISIEGVVTEFSFKNPHALIYLTVTNPDGTTTDWVTEGAAATLLRNRGWGAQSLKPGDVVRVGGDSTHDGSPMISMESVSILDPASKQVTTVLMEDESAAATEYADSSAAAGGMGGAEGMGMGGGMGAGGMGRRNQPIVKVTTPLTIFENVPNISGAWATNGGASGAGPGRRPELPYNEAGKAAQATFLIEHDTQVFCDAPGVVRQAGTTPHPYIITQLEDKIIIEYEEYGGRREIPYGTELPPPGVKTHLGDSVAWIDDGAIVVHTVNLLGNLISPEGTYVSDQTWTVETYRRNDNQAHGSVLDFTMVVNDPLYLTEPFVQTKSKALVEGYEMIENDCQPPLRERTVVSPYTTFFVTSVRLGEGANLGGLAGADAHCEALADNVGHGGKGWKAYLSTTGEGGVNARDRIGAGPWYNSKGDLLAANLDQLHGDNNLTGETVVTELGAIIPSRETENGMRSWHDIMTGSQNDGTALVSEEDTTCANWTSDSEGAALMGHHNREGGGYDATSWVNAHASRGCSTEDLMGSGSIGLYYCFASAQSPITPNATPARSAAAPAQPPQEPDLSATAGRAGGPPADAPRQTAAADVSTTDTSGSDNSASPTLIYIIGGILLAFVIGVFLRKGKA